jgi:hypothetical protein
VSEEGPSDNERHRPTEPPETERTVDEPRFTEAPDTVADPTTADATVDEPPPSVEAPRASAVPKTLRPTMPASVVSRETVADGPPIEDPLTAASEPAPKPRKKRRVLRWIARIFIVLLALIGIGAAIVAVYWQEILRAVVIAQAKKHGVELDFESVTLTREKLTLKKAHVQLEDLSSVDVHTDDLQIALDSHFEPTSAIATGVHVGLADVPKVTLSAERATADVVDFAPKNIHIEHVTVDAPTVADLLVLAKVGLAEPLVSIKPDIAGVHVTVAKLSSAWAVPLDLRASSVTMDPKKATLTRLETTIPIVDMPVSLEKFEIVHDAGRYALVVAEAPELSLLLDEDAKTLHASVTKVPAEILATKLGWSRPPGFALTAQIDLRIPEKDGDVPSGAFTATLDHYIPPHPAELDGIVFGDATKAKGSFALRSDKIALTELKADAGALHLEGKVT